MALVYISVNGSTFLNYKCIVQTVADISNWLVDLYEVFSSRLIDFSEGCKILLNLRYVLEFLKYNDKQMLNGTCSTLD